MGRRPLPAWLRVKAVIADYRDMRMEAVRVREARIRAVARAEPDLPTELLEERFNTSRDALRRLLGTPDLRRRDMELSRGEVARAKVPGWVPGLGWYSGRRSV